MKKSLPFLSIMMLLCAEYAYSQPFSYTAISKYEFKVNNRTAYHLVASMGGQSRWIMAGGSAVFNTYDVKRNRPLQAQYRLRDYQNRKNVLEDRLRNLVGVQLTADLLKGLAKGYNIYRTNDALDRFLGNVIISFIYEAYKRDHKKKVEGLLKRYAYNELVYEASNGAQNIFSSYFAPQYGIESDLRKSKFYQRAYSGIIMMDGSLIASKPHLNDYWGDDNNKTAYSIGASVMISPEFRWSRRGKWCSRFYLTGLYEQVTANLRGDHHYFVGAPYITDAQQDFYLLNNTEDIDLALHQWGAGIKLNTFAGSRFFFDIGAGYLIQSKANLHFAEDDKKPYFADGVSLANENVKSVATPHKDLFNTPYASIGLGYQFGASNFHKRAAGRGLYFYANAMAYQPNWHTGENYHLFTANTTDPTAQEFAPQEVPFPARTDDKFFYTIKIGLGLSF